MTGLQIFTNNSWSGVSHHGSLLKQADRLDVDHLPEAKGEFHDPQLQALQDRLVAEGPRLLQDAISVGVLIEATGMANIAAAVELTEEPVLDAVYGNLLAASEAHLEAFESLL